MKQRQQQIVAPVRRRGFVTIELLAQRIDKTPQTIRRDINQLCGQALPAHHHGGAGSPWSVENARCDLLVKRNRDLWQGAFSRIVAGPR